MRKLFLVAMMVTVGAALSGCFSTVPPGNVGILVNLYGSDKGVQAKEVGTGRYWLTPNESLYLFPTFTQTYTWTGGNKEQIKFQSVEGLSITADVGITYHITADKASVLFQKYRRNIEEITDTYIHNMVRDGFVEESSKLPIETIYGKGKSELIAAVQKKVQGEVADIGLVIEKVYLVDDLILPEAVIGSINSKIKATQMAEQRQNEVAQSVAEANKEIAAANGVGQSKLIVAEAEAKAIKLKADALRDSPQLVQWEAVSKWNGQLPTVTGAATPFINLK